MMPLYSGITELREGVPVIFQAVSPVEFYSGIVESLEGGYVHVRPTDKRIFVEDIWRIPRGSSQKCCPIPAEILERAVDSEEPYMSVVRRNYVPLKESFG